jgi:hypothetical protein
MTQPGPQVMACGPLSFMADWPDNAEVQVWCEPRRHGYRLRGATTLETRYSPVQRDRGCTAQGREAGSLRSASRESSLGRLIGPTASAVPMMIGLNVVCRPWDSDQAVPCNSKFLQVSADDLSLWLAKAVERLGEEIAADPQARQRTFETLEETRFVLPNAVDRGADSHDDPMERFDPCEVPREGGLVEIDVQTRHEVGPAADAAMAAQQDGLAQKLFGPHQQ